MACCRSTLCLGASGDEACGKSADCKDDGPAVKPLRAPVPPVAVAVATALFPPPSLSSSTPAALEPHRSDATLAGPLARSDFEAS